jgi:hypothetical protein
VYNDLSTAEISSNIAAVAESLDLGLIEKLVAKTQAIEQATTDYSSLTDKIEDPYEEEINKLQRKLSESVHAEKTVIGSNNSELTESSRNKDFFSE